MMVSWGDFRYHSTVTTGTWSFDVFIPEKGGTTNDITFIASQLDTEGEEWSTMWMTIENQPYTLIALHHWSGDPDTLVDAVTIRESERLTGWHHVDITRKDSGNIKIYFDGELYLDTIVDYPCESDYFYNWFCCEGPALDNVVIRNQVIDIQPQEEE